MRFPKKKNQNSAHPSRKGSMKLKNQKPQKAHVATLKIYLPNFNFVAQFGGELCEIQTQNIRKPVQNPKFLGCKGRSRTEKSKLPKSSSTTSSKSTYQI